jgi:HSP20 family molecular chaperone IbpA
MHRWRNHLCGLLIVRRGAHAPSILRLLILQEFQKPCQTGPSCPPGILEHLTSYAHICWRNRSKKDDTNFERAGCRKGPHQSRFTRTLENMSRVPSLSSPFLLGFDEIERALDRVAKAADGYPPYNIERVARENGDPERLRITLAVAGFTRDQLDVTVEESQLVIRGRQQDDKTRQYLHRGIAARQFQRTFVLADGMEVLGADLKNGLLAIDLARPEPERVVKTIAITDSECE